MQIDQCLHVAILVSDLQRAEDFYGGVLGLPTVERVAKVGSSTTALNFAGTWYQVGGFQIHLIVQPQMQQSLQDSQKWGRNAHVAFAVADLETAKQTLLAHGAPVQSSASGRLALFTQDPDGNVIELSQG